MPEHTEHVDRHLRAAIEEIAEMAPPEVDWNQLDDKTMSLGSEKRPEPPTADFSNRRFLRLAVAAVVVLVAGIMLIETIGDAPSRETSTASEELTTTTLETATSTTAAAAETTNLERISSWTEYLGLVDSWEAQECATRNKMLWQLPLLIDVTDNFRNATDSVETLRTAEDVLWWLGGVEAYAKLRMELESIRRPEDVASLSEWLVVLGQTRDSAQAASPSSMMDIGPVIRGAVAYSQVMTSGNCVFGDEGEVSLALTTFSESDIASLGGYGREAGLRCRTSVVLRSALDELLETGDPSIGPRIDATWDLFSAYWSDRPIDDEVVTLMERWSALEIGAAELSEPARAEIQAIADDFLTYRASAPDGALCPLDETYEQ